MLHLASSSLAAPAAATSRALAPQGPAPDCPSIAEVNATPIAERWAVWDVPRCSSGCKFPSDQCGLGAPCCVHQRWAASRISSSRVTLSLILKTFEICATSREVLALGLSLLTPLFKLALCSLARRLRRALAQLGSLSEFAGLRCVNLSLSRSSLCLSKRAFKL